MYKQMKKVWKLALAMFIVVATLAACGGGGGNAEQVLRLASVNPLNSLNHVSTSEAANFQVIGSFLEGAHSTSALIFLTALIMSLAISILLTASSLPATKPSGFGQVSTISLFGLSKYDHISSVIKGMKG